MKYRYWYRDIALVSSGIVSKGKIVASQIPNHNHYNVFPRIFWIIFYHVCTENIILAICLKLNKLFADYRGVITALALANLVIMKLFPLNNVFVKSTLATGLPVYLTVCFFFVCVCIGKHVIIFFNCNAFISIFSK